MNVQQQILRTIDIKQALSRLSPEQFAVIVLHYYVGLKYEEIASELGSPRWQVKKWIYEALCIIRTLWGVRLPQKSRNPGGHSIDSSWWPLLMESLWQHASGVNLGVRVDVRNQTLLGFDCVPSFHNRGVLGRRTRVQSQVERREP
jgi:hypothetical protein